MDLSVVLAGPHHTLRLKNPVMTASGTFGYGAEFEPYGDLTQLGGIVVKGLSLQPREGNPCPRIAETTGGMLNAVGLQNDGVETFCKRKLPHLPWRELPVVANLYATSPEEFGDLAARLDEEEGIAALEVNVSCPNVKVGGMAYGVKAEAAGEVVRMVRTACKKPLMVKLSPQAENIPEMCKAVEAAGADAISLTNTFQACAIDLEKRRPVFNNIFAGLSGPAVRPIALRMVWQAVGAVNIPVVGLGGIATGRDALEFIMAGATAVQVGAANFANPRAMETIANEMAAWMDKNGVKTLDEIRGCARHAE